MKQQVFYRNRAVLITGTPGTATGTPDDATRHTRIMEAAEAFELAMDRVFDCRPGGDPDAAADIEHKAVLQANETRLDTLARDEGLTVHWPGWGNSKDAGELQKLAAAWEKKGRTPRWGGPGA